MAELEEAVLLFDEDEAPADEAAELDELDELDEAATELAADELDDDASDDDEEEEDEVETEVLDELFVAVEDVEPVLDASELSSPPPPQAASKKLRSSVLTAVLNEYCILVFLSRRSFSGKPQPPGIYDQSGYIPVMDINQD